jgi:hypothetical protein
VPASYAAVQMVRTINPSDAIDTVLFHFDVPDPVGEAVTNFKMLPERMNQTCSECN